MKSRAVFVPLTIALTLAALLTIVLRPAPELAVAPQFELPRLGGGPPVSSAAFAGRPWVVNVWASWCVSCRAEVPYLRALQESGAVVVGLNYKDAAVPAAAWLQKYGDPFTVHAIDAAGTIGAGFGVDALPETFVIDAEGVIVFRHVGAVDDQGDLDDMLAALSAAS